MGAPERDFPDPRRSSASSGRSGFDPADIAEREFLPALQGYEKQEVRDFLTDISRQMEALMARTRDLEEELRRGRNGSDGAASPGPGADRRSRDAGEAGRDVTSAALPPQEIFGHSAGLFREVRSAVDEMLTTAERAAADLQRDAERLVQEQLEEERARAEAVAEEILDQAREEADGIVRDARESSDEILESARTDAAEVRRSAEDAAEASRREAAEIREAAEKERESIVGGLREERERLLDELDRLEVRRRQLIRALQGAVSDAINDTFEATRERSERDHR